jgi:hypothetical protein
MLYFLCRLILSRHQVPVPIRAVQTEALLKLRHTQCSFKNDLKDIRAKKIVLFFVFFKDHKRTTINSKKKKERKRKAMCQRKPKKIVREAFRFPFVYSFFFLACHHCFHFPQATTPIYKCVKRYQKRYD